MDRHCFDTNPNSDPDLDGHQNGKSGPDRQENDAYPKHGINVVKMHFGNEDGNGIFVFSNVPNGSSSNVQQTKIYIFFKFLTFS